MKQKNSSGVNSTIVRTTGGLRDALFDEIDRLRNGNSNAATARALAMLANTALNSVKVEIEFHKYVSDAASIDGAAKLGILELGKGDVNLVPEITHQ